MPVPFVGSLASFLVALLVGGLAIFLSAKFVVGVEDYSHAVITALIGAIAWSITAWIVPFVGSIVALVVWVGVIKWRYPGGWVKAGIIGAIAWVAALVILFVLNSVLQLGVGAFGIPGA